MAEGMEEVETAAETAAEVTNMALTGSLGGGLVNQGQNGFGATPAAQTLGAPAPAQAGRQMPAATGSPIPGTSASQILPQYMAQLNQPAPSYATQTGPGMGGPGGFQGSYDTGSAVNTNQVGATPMPVSSVGQASPYFQQAADSYYNQAKSRLDPQWQAQQQGLESQLSAQGLTQGSQAWNSEMDRLTRGRNDAYGSAINQSILTGGQEASRMQGMDINSGNFANQAAQANFQNQLTSQQAYNQAQQQQYGQNQQAGQFHNQALAQQQQAAQGWGNLAQQRYATQQNTMGQMAGVEANRYGTEQAYRTGLGNQQAQLGSAQIGAGATVGAATLNAQASQANAALQAKTTMAGYANQMGIAQGGWQNAAQLQAAQNANQMGMAQGGWQTSKDINAAQNANQMGIAGLQSQTAQRGQDVGLAGQMYGSNMGYAGQQLGANTQLGVAGMNNATQLGVAGLGAQTAQRGQDVGLLGQLAGYQNESQIASGNNATQRYGYDASLASNMYNTNANYALGQGQLSLAQDSQNFNQLNTMYNMPLQTQNALTNGQLPSNPAYSGYTNMGSPGNVGNQGGAAAAASNTANAGAAQGWSNVAGSLGGLLTPQTPTNQVPANYLYNVGV